MIFNGKNKRGDFSRICARYIGYVLLCCMASLTSANSRTFIDMAGRTETVPDTVTRVTAIHPIISHMLWRLAPEKISSIDIEFKDRLYFMSDAEKKRLLSLPVTASLPNMQRETILQISPDIVVSLKKDLKIDARQEAYGLPVVAASKDSLAEYADSWRLMGELVGKESEGNQFGTYWDTLVKDITDISDKIPAERKLKVYYAQPSITTTVGPETIMASIIRYAGGVDFFQSHKINVVQSESESVVVSLENIVSWDPDVIITKTAAARDEILSSPAWGGVAAVKSGRVYSTLKYAMLDRIQAGMGLYWCAETLYPDRFNYDFSALMRDFYKKVYFAEAMSDEQIWEKLK